MAALVCDICGGKLIGKPGGIFECDSCGMEYSQDWAKEKIQEIKGTVKVEGTVNVQGSVTVDNKANLENLLNRAFMFLEDKDWENADAYAEKVLEHDSVNGTAYVIKFLSDIQISSLSRIRDIIDNSSSQSFLKRTKYLSKVYSYADKDIVEKLKKDLVYVNAQIEFMASEKEYIDAKNILLSAKNEKDCKRAIKKFEKIKEFKDSKSLIDECYVKITELENCELERRNAIALKRLDLFNKSSSSSVTAKKFDDSIEEINSQIEQLKSEKAEIQKSLDELENEITRSSFVKKIKLKGTKDDLFNQISLKDNEIKLKLDYIKKMEYKRSFYEKIQNGSLRMSDFKKTLSISNTSCSYLKNNGSVVTVGESNEINTNSWTNIVEISSCLFHCLGLKANGTVVASGNNNYNQCDVQNWRNIVSVSAGLYHSVGLKADGTVVSTKVSGLADRGQTSVSDWNDVITISASVYHTVGLKSNGTVVATKEESLKEYYNGFSEVDEWKNIVAISAGMYHTVGLKSNGTVVSTKISCVKNRNGQTETSSWKNIVAVAAGSSHTVGLKDDGTVVAVGKNDFGECNVSAWKNIVAIAVTDCRTIGLKADGTLVFTGEEKYQSTAGINGASNIKLF